MKRILSYRLLLLLTITFFITANGYSQEEKVTVDTTIEMTPDENTAPPAEEDTFYPDTLKLDYRSVVYDSIQAINADRGFYYKRYMDSLLRSTEMRIKKMLELRRKDSLRRDSLIKAGKLKPGQSGRSTIDSRTFFNSAFGIIFLIIAVGLFGYIIFKLFLSNSYFFSRNRKNISVDIAVATEENINDPDALLRNAIKNGNYRLAIRYLYLQTLMRLSDRKLIEINSNKTNYEYVSELRKHKFANEFASLTLKYEYVWYGEYPVNERLFEQIQGSFTQFNKNHLK